MVCATLKIIVSLNDSCKYRSCIISPTIINNIVDKDIISPTLSLFHYVIANNLECSFFVDEKNNSEFVLSCTCHDKTYCPSVICINNLDSQRNVYADIENKWTDFKKNPDILKELIEQFTKEYFSDKKVLYKIEFTPAFLSRISTDYSNRNNIISAISNRIVKTQKESCDFTSLDDEPIKGTRNKTRFFRGNSECRIQYTYPDKGTIKLIKYSGLGEHDKNLSQTRR